MAGVPGMVPLPEQFANFTLEGGGQTVQEREVVERELAVLERGVLERKGDVDDEFLGEVRVALRPLLKHMTADQLIRLYLGVVGARAKGVGSNVQVGVAVQFVGPKPS